MIEPRLGKHKSKLNIVPKEYLGIFFDYITTKIASKNLCYPNKLYKGVKTPGLLSINLNPLVIEDPYENYKQYIFKCFNNDKINIILIPIIVYDKILNTSHFNAVIINKNTKRIEYFEPYGTYTIYNKNFKKIVHHYFTKLINNNQHKYEFKFTEHHCPRGLPRGLQSLQEREERMPKGTGLCTAWNILIMHIIILNPKYKTSEIVNILIEKYPSNLTKYIREYISFLEELAYDSKITDETAKYQELLSDMGF